MEAFLEDLRQVKLVPWDTARGVAIEMCARTEWEDPECVRSVTINVVTRRGREIDGPE